MSTYRNIKCPVCGNSISIYANPVPTVDIIICMEDTGIVLIQRKNIPYGWAIPGGFVDYGESLEQAAVREAYEETGLHVRLEGLLGVYSDPDRDRRMHTTSTVFTARAAGILQAGDDAADAGSFPIHKLPSPIAFDHKKILEHYSMVLKGSRCLCPTQHENLLHQESMTNK